MSGKKNNTRKALTDDEKRQAKIDNFKRLLPVRMDKANKAIRMVGDCSSSNYTYTVKDAECIVADLRASVDNVQKRFSGEASKTTEFQLPE